MSFVCSKCSKTLASQASLNSHLYKRKTPCVKEKNVKHEKKIVSKEEHEKIMKELQAQSDELDKALEKSKADYIKRNTKKFQEVTVEYCRVPNSIFNVHDILLWASHWCSIAKEKGISSAEGFRCLYDSEADTLTYEHRGPDLIMTDESLKYLKDMIEKNRSETREFATTENEYICIYITTRIVIPDLTKLASDSSSVSGECGIRRPSKGLGL